jgi:hypothetical protein
MCRNFVSPASSCDQLRIPRRTFVFFEQYNCQLGGSLALGMIQYARLVLGTARCKIPFLLHDPILHEQWHRMIFTSWLRSNHMKHTLSMTRWIPGQRSHMALLKADNSKSMYFPRKACQANDRLELLLPADIRFSLPLLHPHTHSHPQYASQQLHQQLPASHHKLIKTTHHHLHRQPDAVHTGWRGVSMSDDNESILSSEASIHHRTNTDHNSQACQHSLLLLLLLLSLVTTSTAKESHVDSTAATRARAESCRLGQPSKHR